MRYLIPAFASLVMATSSLPVRAQTPAPVPQQNNATTAAPGATPAPAPAKPEKANQLSRRFTAANTTHDGQKGEVETGGPPFR
eukprot:gene13701-13817_t